MEEIKERLGMEKRKEGKKECKKVQHQCHPTARE
jgi:hypothetical protein